MTPGVAVNVLWGIWYATWIAAVVFSSRTRVQMRTDMGGWHRLFAGAGAILLFWPFVLWSHLRNGGWAGALDHRLWPPHPGLDWSFFALAAAAFAFCWWARLHLGRLWSGFVTLKQGHRIVDTGPYGLVRHPIYSGVITAALATALIRATPVGIAGFALLALGVSMTARVEEGFLRDQLGAEVYDSYARRVGGLVPHLR